MDETNSSATTKWPDKNDREDWEINEFLNVVYARLRPKLSLRIVEKREKPDYLVVDDITGNKFFVELTATYIDDRSVPDKHKPAFEGLVEPSVIFPLNTEQLKLYNSRIVATFCDKKQKAQKGYDTSYPLILSVYMNEYIYLTGRDLENLVSCNQELFNDITPFHEVVFWPLSNEEAYVLPDNSNCPSEKNLTKNIY